MENCIFCKIVSKEIPARIIYENEHVLAFLDINPVAKGHSIVIPKKHATDILELDDKSAGEILKAAKRISQNAVEKLGAAGINLLNSNKKQAGQTVFHYHMHMIPRYENDGIHVWPNSGYKENDFDGVLKALALK